MNKSSKKSQNPVWAYIQKSVGLILKSAIWAAVCMALNIGLLYFSQLLLGFYLKTPMGPDFKASNPELMDTIGRLTDMGFENLSLHAVLTVLLTCLAVTAVCKVFFISRYITPMGFIGRFLTCVLPLSAVAAAVLPESVPAGGWSMAYALSLFPTAVLFNICFTVTDELLPEIDDILSLFQKKDASGKTLHGRK